jgi:SnoaL-like polyketide cyclase
VLDELIDPQPFVGKRNVKAWFDTWRRTVPDSTSEIVTILGVGEFVLAETVVRGTLTGQLGRVLASGKAFAVHRAAIFQVREGKLKRVSGFMNGKELAKAVGQWPPPIGK